jgi:protein-disulfide isomerase
MTRFWRNFLLILCVASLAAFCQAPARKAAVPPRPAPAAKPPAKTALDKATFEAYLRHLFVWGSGVNVAISDPKPSSELDGFLEVTAHASLGEAVQDETFLISKNGRKILKAMVFDVAQNPFKPDLDNLKTQFQPSMGTPNAPVVLVVFTDFQCPVCKEEGKMLRQNLLSAYPRQVRLYFKDFPLVQIHPWAKIAALAGRCIFRQNPAAFWDYYDWIYDHQSEVTADNFRQKLSEFVAGKEIDGIQLARCLDERATEAEVDRGIAEGKALNVRATPTLFINGRRLEGQIPWPSLREIIDYEIEYQKTAKNAGEDCGCEVKLPSPLEKPGAAPTLGGPR